MNNLGLRPIGPDDYAVIDDGEPVGRIRFAAERGREIWMWNCTVLVPGGPNGTAASLDDAKTAFQESWLKFKCRIGPEDLI